MSYLWACKLARGVSIHFSDNVSFIFAHITKQRRWRCWLQGGKQGELCKYSFESSGKCIIQLHHPWTHKQTFFWNIYFIFAHIAKQRRRRCRLQGGKQGEAIKASNIYDLLFFCHAYGSVYTLAPPSYSKKKKRSKTLDMLDKLPESTQTAI